MRNCCQSCGMPMRQDPQGGGTNADGSRTPRYCSYCYHQGAFTQPEMTAVEMQEFCIDKLKEQGTPRWIGWLLTRGIPRLGRWNKHRA